MGKGTLATVVARRLARAQAAVRYLKLEPCLQGDLEALPNTAFGEIVRFPNGVLGDGDVARAAFYVPGFVPCERSDLSLGRLLDGVLTTVGREPAPRLARFAAVLAEVATTVEDEFLVVEVGGTSGEAEHALLLQELVRGLGRPRMHLHLTQVVRTIDGRATTKPAQLSLDALTVPPDVVTLRLAGPEQVQLADTIRSRLPPDCELALQVGKADWPEAAFDARVSAFGLEQRLMGSHVAVAPDSALRACRHVRPVDVAWIDDGAGLEGYGSLVRRLAAWSHACVRLVPADTIGGAQVAGVIRIGECSPPPIPKALCGLPTLEIVPIEAGLGPRDPAARPDWQGTADSPCGPVATFIHELLGASALRPFPKEESP